jgi:hypothetical protein
MKNLVFLALAVCAAGSASADLTTVYGSDNGGSAGGMVYFDAVVNSNALLITGFDTNYAGTDAFGWEVWTRPGTYLGNAGSSAGWTMVATGTGVGATENSPSVVTLSNSFTIGANATTGFALRLTAANTGHEYTNGTGANQTFSNADLTLNLGAADNTPFAGGGFTPRVWNGTIKYSPVPEPATFAVLGLGALALVRRRRAVK